MELSDFEGAWRIDRIVSHDAGREALFEGVAQGEPDGAGLVWREAGRLAMDGRSWEATRRHLWRPAPGGIAVLFEDGRPFHRIDLGAPRATDTHRCGRDLYRVAYDFTAWPRWTAAWRVDGPRHAYAMVSRHAPLAGGAAMRHLRARQAEDGDDP